MYPTQTGWQASMSTPTERNCLIPVDDNNEITVTGNFEGSVLTGSFDLLVDGSLLREEPMLYSSDRVASFKKRSFDFAFVYNFDAGKGSITPKDRVTQGQLYAKPLQHPVKLKINSSNTGNNFGLGTLVVVVNVTGMEMAMHQRRFESSTCGSWRKHATQDQSNNAGILPTHELSFTVTDRRPFPDNKKVVHQPNMQRFGTKPWAIFIFHYRSSRAVHDVGSKPIPDISFALGSAEAAQIIAKDPQQSTNKPGDEQTDSRQDIQSGQGSQLGVSGAPMETTVDSTGRGLFVTPSPVDRRQVIKLPGLALPPPPPRSTPTSEPVVKSPVQQQQLNAPVEPMMRKKKTLFGQSFTLPPMPMTTLQSPGPTSSGPNDEFLNAMLSIENPDLTAAEWPPLEVDPFANFEYPTLPQPSKNSAITALGQVVQTYDDGDDYQDELFLAQHLSPEPSGHAKQNQAASGSYANQMDNSSYQSLAGMSGQYPFAPQPTQGTGDLQHPPRFIGSNNQPPPPSTPQNIPQMQVPSGKDDHNNGQLPASIGTPTLISKRARSPSNKSNPGTPSSKMPRKEMNELEAIKSTLRRQVEETKQRKAELIEQRRQEEQRRLEAQERAQEEKIKAEIEQLRKELAEANREVEQMEKAQAEWAQHEEQGKS